MPPLIAQGLELAALGMGTVFVFLTVLVFAIMLMSKLVNLTNTSMDVAKNPATQHKTAITGMDPKKLAVISAAIHQHRKQ